MEQFFKKRIPFQLALVGLVGFLSLQVLTPESLIKNIISYGVLSLTVLFLIITLYIKPKGRRQVAQGPIVIDIFTLGLLSLATVLFTKKDVVFEGLFSFTSPVFLLVTLLLSYVTYLLVVQSSRIHTWLYVLGGASVVLMIISILKSVAVGGLTSAALGVVFIGSFFLMELALFKKISHSIAAVSVVVSLIGVVFVSMYSLWGGVGFLVYMLLRGYRPLYESIESLLGKKKFLRPVVTIFASAVIASLFLWAGNSVLQNSIVTYLPIELTNEMISLVGTQHGSIFEAVAASQITLPLEFFSAIGEMRTLSGVLDMLVLRGLILVGVMLILSFLIILYPSNLKKDGQLQGSYVYGYRIARRLLLVTLVTMILLPGSQVVLIVWAISIGYVARLKSADMTLFALNWKRVLGTKAMRTMTSVFVFFIMISVAVTAQMGYDQILLQQKAITTEDFSSIRSDSWHRVETLKHLAAATKSLNPATELQKALQSSVYAFSLNPFDVRNSLNQALVYKSLGDIGIEGAYDRMQALIDFGLRNNPKQPMLALMAFEWSIGAARVDIIDPYFSHLGNFKDILGSDYVLSAAKYALLKGDFKSALPLFEELVQSNIYIGPEIYVGLAISHSELGNKERALELMQSLVDSYPDNKEYSNLFQRILGQDK